MTRRLTPMARRDEIVAAAVRVSCTVGYNRITREDIALAAGCSPALVSHILGTMCATRRAIVREAVRVGCLPVIAQGLALRDPHALKAPEALRLAAAGSLTS